MKDIILLHGALGAADQLELLAAALQQKQLTTHCLNFTGHGQVPFDASFGIERFAVELENYILSKQLSKPAVFGYSMGGYVALYLACQRPELLGPVATLGSKFAWSPEMAAKEVKMLDAATILEKVPKYAAALRARHGANWEVLLQRTADMMLGLGRQPLLDEGNFSSIENRVLLGLADRDAMVSVDETLAVYHSLKHGNLYMLPATKHPIETVNVALLASLISGWLQG